ncbi:hypothetical protein [Marinicella gelatinilytica]|uniref:hypothetical protein n=1 Tax=Marinicella gelatinilytica TaxID=2996017 RepID=UPI002260B785|nr:hypothetical protein [Marinicella gelatinilytica]MCX7544707.1 hypothetical protein [Marinicella gelatinilytica]
MNLKFKYFFFCYGLFLIHCSAHASFVFVPFEQLLADAELVVSGTIIDKKCSEKKSTGLIFEQNPITGESYIKETVEYDAFFTDYELHVDEILKGGVAIDVIQIEAGGGCDDEGYCRRLSTGYELEVGDRVFMLLKKDKGGVFYVSVQGGNTVYYLTDNSQIYNHHDNLEYIYGQSFDSNRRPVPQNLIEIKEIIKQQEYKDYQK